MTQDTAIKITEANIRRPDVTINCGPRTDNAFHAGEPRIVFEVLSPSTRDFDEDRKREEYKRVVSIRYIVLVDPDTPEVIVFERAGDGAWASRTHKGLDDEIKFVDPGFSLPLAEIYRGLSFRPRPTLVVGE